MTGQLPVGGRCFYTLQGQNGLVITIAMNKQSNTLDPYLRLNTPCGVQVKYDDDSGGNYNSLIANYQLNQTGPWTIVAGSRNNQ